MPNQINFEIQPTFSGNKYHLKVLLNAINKDDISIWNNWRSEDTRVVPILNGINLSGANLMGVDFTATDLVGANLSNANLSQAELDGAYLQGANLEGAKLHHASFHSGSLVKANLKNSYLSSVRFNNCKLNGADLSGANIHGFSTTDWEIKDVKCTNVYTDLNSKKRLPLERDFEQGEFERMYEYHPTIDLEYEDGLDSFSIFIADYATIQLNKEMSGFDFRVTEINIHGSRPVIKIEVKEGSNVEEGRKLILEKIAQYEKQMKELDFDKKALYKILELALKGKTQITFNDTTNIERSIIGENFGAQNNQTYDISFNQIEKIEKELSDSNIAEKDKTEGKNIITKLKEKTTEETISQLIEWAKQLTAETLKKIPTLLGLIGQYLG